MNRCNAQHGDSAEAGQILKTSASDSVNPSNLQSSVATESTVALRREMQDIKWSGLLLASQSAS